MRGPLFVALLSILFACSNHGAGKINIIEAHKMTKIMADVYILEMHYQKSGGTPATYQKPLKKAIGLLLKQHGVSEKEYNDSFLYYSADHKKFMEMNDAVIQEYNKQLLIK